MASQGSIIQKSSFSSGILYEKSWVDQTLVATGSGTTARNLYFVASVFTFRGYVVNVFLGNSINEYLLQYWNGSAWQTLLSQTIQDTQSVIFEINITTSESCTYRKQSSADKIWWRLNVRNTNNYYPSFNDGRLRLYGLNVHVYYDSNIKEKYIKGYLRSSQGTPWVHSASAENDVLPSNAYVSDLYNTTSLRGNMISAGVYEYAILLDNI
jgi:hypothetical protein